MLQTILFKGLILRQILAYFFLVKSMYIIFLIKVDKCDKYLMKKFIELKQYSTTRLCNAATVFIEMCVMDITQNEQSLDKVRGDIILCDGCHM